MAPGKNFSLIAFSLLLAIPFFCKASASVEHVTDTEEPGSGEVDENSRPRQHPDHGASPDEREEEEETQTSIGQGQDPGADEEDTEQQSTPSSVAAVGKEHLPREQEDSDEEEEDEEESEEIERGENDSEERDHKEDESDEEDEHNEEENVEVTTSVADSSHEVPLAPIPPEVGEDPVHQDEDSSSPQPPHNDILNPEPSKTIVIWDGTSEPDRDQSSNEPEQPSNQPELPVSQELHGGSNGNSNGNGIQKESESVHEDKSNSEDVQEDRPLSKPVPVSSSGSASSSMAWVVVFAVVSSALLISGMSDSETHSIPSCYLGCRHNYDDFNPYAWPPTSVNRNETTLRPIT